MKDLLKEDKKMIKHFYKNAPFFVKHQEHGLKDFYALCGETKRALLQDKIKWGGKIVLRKVSGFDHP